MASRDAITSASAPDLDEVGAWLHKMIRAMQFAELVAGTVRNPRDHAGSSRAVGWIA